MTSSKAVTLVLLLLGSQQILQPCAARQLQQLIASNSTHQQLLTDSSSAAQLQASASSCDSEKQMVMCGDIPYTLAFRAERVACCEMHQPMVLPAAAQQANSLATEQQRQVRRQIPRSDLTDGLLYPPRYEFGRCTTKQQATVPTFSGRAVTLRSFDVPKLDKGIIQRVKARVYSGLPQHIKDDINRMRSWHSGSGFQHPAACAGPFELAVMRERLRNNNNIQTAARDSLLYGTGVKQKNYWLPGGGTWAPPTNCPADGYVGPLPISKVQIKWSGISASGGECPGNYPVQAPRSNCQHISLVELDAQMSYKMAMAWHVTGDDRYANKVLQIVDAHASTNKEWGLRHENGPLEAGWTIATMARALELVRSKAWPGLIDRFSNWAKAVTLPQMDYYYDVLTKQQQIPNHFGNWHATIAEAMMAVGVLANDRGRYNKGVVIFHDTVKHYLKWGKGSFAQNRILGECSETMRDLYHVQFGLGSLLQAAEIAWQQDDDLYSSDNYALAAAMELHARITNAWDSNRDANMLPQGFKFYEGNMPAPPAGTRWQFDMQKQRWAAVYTSNGAWHSDLWDGVKYLLGIGFLPTGWEMGYNHFVGRLGLKMPETAALLARSWPEWQEMQWGLGTITHANTAQSLWRDGIKDYTLCSNGRRRPSTAGTEQDGQDVLQAPSVAAQSAAVAVGTVQEGQGDDGLYADPLLLAGDMPTDDGVSSLATPQLAGGFYSPDMQGLLAEATTAPAKTRVGAAGAVASSAAASDQQQMPKVASESDVVKTSTD
uniref:Alginate lyase domain-containing protein n=1 Tax=Tetradesmus obliquus TaxID=3088 RepID=A0A383V947_TETOB|eukprot:jgi/Sobl393_1/12001/SZX61302.1